MEKVRKMIEMGLSLRAENGIKVRQPLDSLVVNSNKLDEALEKLLIEEVNVKKLFYKEVGKELAWKEIDDVKVGLDIKISPALKAEGNMRDLIRQLQQARKEADFEIDNRIILYHEEQELFEKFASEIKLEVLIKDLLVVQKEPDNFDYKKEVKIDGSQFKIWLKN